MNSVIALALAKKVYQELKNYKVEEAKTKEQNNLIKSDPNYQKWVEIRVQAEKLYSQASKLETKLERKFSCNLYYNGNNSVRISLNKSHSVPDISIIKDDILLMSWSQNEDLSSEQLIKKLAQKYMK